MWWFAALGSVVAMTGVASVARAADMPVKAEATDGGGTAFSDRWTFTLASEARYYSWKGDRGTPASASASSGSGSQTYIPFAARFTGQPIENVKVDILGRGGWVSARQSSAGLTGNVETFTDTQVSTTVTYLGLNGLQPFAAVLVNVPTGKSALFGTASSARMDPDLVEIASFGEGWNFGPTAGFSISLTPDLIVTASAGYTWRGKFDRERSTTSTDPTVQALTRVDPGDLYTVTAGVAYKTGPLASAVTGSIAEESETTENGAPLYRAGRRYTVSGIFSYTWPDIGVSTVTAAFTHGNRNKVLYAGASALVTEAFNTNADVTRVGLQHLFQIGQLIVGPTGSFLYRTNNSYDPTTLQFVPAKERWAAGALARYAVNEKTMFNARFEHVWVHEDRRPAPTFSVLLGQAVAGSALPPLQSTGWQVAGGFNVSF
jgi:hypothetical protein